MNEADVGIQKQGIREMKENLQRIKLRFIKLINPVIMTIPFVVCWMLYYQEKMWTQPFYRRGNWLMALLYILVYMVYGHIYDAFLVSLVRISELIYSQCLSAFITDAIMYIISWLLIRHLPAVWPLLLVLGAQILISAIWSTIVHQWYFNSFEAKQTVVVYDNREGVEQLLEEYGLDKKFHVKKVINTAECMQEKLENLSDTDVIFLCGVHSHERNVILKYCIANHISVYVIPRIGDVLMSGAKRMHMLHLPILMVERYNPRIEYLFIKRLFDVLLSGIALILLSPIFLITAIAVKVTDGGPVFYRQTRLTKDGKKFDVLKFRSMRIDAEKDGVARLSTGDKDDRITKVGHIIRKVRIDELPQLINILKGDMTIVGPRPERPEIAAQYEEILPEFALRLQVKAGLTGYAQVYGKYNTTPYDKLQMDLMYISKPSLLEDLRIIFATIKILFVPESTEGVEEGRNTAMEKQRVDARWHEVSVEKQ